jgi:hypothetical protein
MAVALEREELEISAAAICSYSRLMRAVRGRIESHGSADGGLICERRISRGRSMAWRILPDGGVVADSPYDYRLGRFVSAPLPKGV